MNDEAFGIRDGEIATELPEKFDASLYFIGRIRTPSTRSNRATLMAMGLGRAGERSAKVPRPTP